MQEWLTISGFPGYSVSNEGYVRNDNTGRIMRQSQNQLGIAYVGLVRKGVQFKRSVTLLVANAFVERPQRSFTTPINLNGDRFDSAAVNIQWRPRPFAKRYFRQFHQEPCGIDQPIVEIRTGERFESSWDAAIKYGLLDLEIRDAMNHRTYVWPTYQQFELVHKKRYHLAGKTCIIVEGVECASAHGNRDSVFS